MTMMKGVILAGGTGSRLFPSTKAVNKHLLPVFNKPMVYYPIETLKKSGIDDILVVTSKEHIGNFMQLLGSGSEFGVNFTFRIQEGAGGIAQALGLAEGFAAGESIALILSDNIFEEDFAEDVQYFTEGAKIFVKEVENPRRFGVVEFDSKGIVKSIEEKPTLPKSNFAQTGFILYDNHVFDIIKTLKPSKRGELEITDVNNAYLKEKKLTAAVMNGLWIDTGTHESLLEGGIILQELAQNPQKRTARTELKSSEYTPKITVGVVTHNSEKYVRHCLQSLQNQEYKNYEIVVFDNNSEDYTVDVIRENFPEVQIIESYQNRGFAKAHNEIIRSTDSEFYACVNIDMIFEQNFLSRLVEAIKIKPIIGATGGKIKRWDFKSMKTNPDNDDELGKTNFIDSVGIKFLKSHRFEDIGQNEVDYGQYDESKSVFGISGAAVLFRRKALDDVAFTNENGDKEYFDESMFMYKEDIDLAYRLQWAGWKARYTPHAVSYHDRSVSILGNAPLDVLKNRSQKDKRVNRLSYLNHHILLKKNYDGDFSMDIRKATGWYNLKVLLYISIFETELLSEWWKLFRMRKALKAKRKSAPRRVSNTDIEKLMEN